MTERCAGVPTPAEARAEFAAADDGRLPGRDAAERFFFWLIGRGLLPGDLADPERMTDRMRCFREMLEAEPPGKDAG